jgi:hypothetical protein
MFTGEKPTARKKRTVATKCRDIKGGSPWLVSFCRETLEDRTEHLQPWKGDKIIAQVEAKRNPGCEITTGREAWKGRRNVCPDVLIILAFPPPLRGEDYFFCFPRISRATAVTRSTLGYDPSSLRDYNQQPRACFRVSRQKLVSAEVAGHTSGA